MLMADDALRVKLGEQAIKLRYVLSDSNVIKLWEKSLKLL
jgi:hypothetical protein